ncbi:MAG TPA: UDP-3-O-(3-hydroxymyristoyl)glucosamine N-acyltransferase [Planctomycetota bacterium]|nr:UDP-3-O-(3-hydroxymyristoyl)glucosamine N-acyltransferase [Planctomycetota bacterium]
MSPYAAPRGGGWTVSQITQLVGGRTDSNSKQDVLITGISGIRDAAEGDITFVSHRRYLPLVKESRASAIIVDELLKVDESNPATCFIRVNDPGSAFAKVAERFVSEKAVAFEPGVHPTAIIAGDAKLGRNVVIQAYVVVAEGAVIGDDTVIYPQAYIGHYSKIGSNCLLYPGVTVRERVAIGNNVIIHSGAVVGSDGFGFFTVNGVHKKIPQVGTVEIEDDVEIGANVTIDRARFEKTHIGRGTKIDNLVQIAHNVYIGERCVIVAQSGIAGSSRIGNNVIVAAQAGIDGHLEVGDNTIITGKAGVTKNIPANVTVSGFPAQKHDKQRREQIHLRKLPEYCAKIKDLEERLSLLEKAAENHRK